MQSKGTISQRMSQCTWTQERAIESTVRMLLHNGRSVGVRFAECIEKGNNLLKRSIEPLTLFALKHMRRAPER